MVSHRRLFVTVGLVATVTAIPLLSVGAPAQAVSSVCGSISAGSVIGLASRPAHVTVALASSFGSTSVTITECSKTSTGAYAQSWQSAGRTGYNGFAAAGAKREGDGKTPTGVFTFGTAFGAGNPGSVNGYITLQPSSCWGSTVGSANYNRYFTGTCGASDESMYKYVGTAYRQGLLINYNRQPIRQGYGSAIFFHVSTGGTTAGCISTDYNSVVKMIQATRPGDVIVQGVTSAVITGVPATPFGDFNGNGWSDLITRRTSDGSLYVYPGHGTGLGGASLIGRGWNAMSSITRLGDFNRDGHEDIIASETVTGALWLYPGTGAGFAPRMKLGSGWNSMREITPVGDLTGDGYPDLLAVRAASGYLYLYPGRGTSFGAARQLGPGWNAMSELAGAGDFNKDGHVDVLARNTAAGDLWLYRGTATSLGAPVRVGSGWNAMRDLVGVGDFNRDGFNDAIAVEVSTGRLFMYPGRGTGFGSRLLVGSGWTGLQPLL